MIGRHALGIAITLLALSGAALADDEPCPPDRPVRRQVIDFSRPVMCTLLACTGDVVCPADKTQPCRAVPSNCNTCSPPTTYSACFARNEICGTGDKRAACQN